MKKKVSVYLKILVICICLSVVLFSVFSVSVTLNAKPVQETPQNIPYMSDEAPEYFGLLMRFSGGNSVYFGFDKINSKTSVVMLGIDADASEISQYGYSLDTTADADYDFLAGLIDNFGGIELTSEDGTFSYTGVQITDMLKKTGDIEFKKRVIIKLLSAMRVQGVNRADLLMLIDGTETNLNFPSVYHLHNTINSSLKTVTFVN